MLVKVNCAQCGFEMNEEQHMYNRLKRKIFFCSDECYDAFQAVHKDKRIRRRERIILECCMCGTKIWCADKDITKRKICSIDCLKKWMKKNQSGKNNPIWNSFPVNCAYCGKEKYVAEYRLKEYNKFFCNTTCMGKWQSANRAGENSPLYIKDRSKIKMKERDDWDARPEHKRWKYLIHKRDGKRCNFCGTKVSNPCLHHIVPFSVSKEKRDDVDNGVTLCFDCHTMVHTANTIQNYIYSCYMWSDFKKKRFVEMAPKDINECIERRNMYFNKTMLCPKCGKENLEYNSGCVTCQSCGWSICSI